MADIFKFPSQQPSKVPDIDIPLPQDAVVSFGDFKGQFYVMIHRRRPKGDFSINAFDYRNAGSYATKAEALRVAVDLATRFKLEIIDDTASAESIIDGGNAA